MSGKTITILLSSASLLIGLILQTTRLQPVHAANGWYDYGWDYRKKIAIDHMKVPNTDQSNFPVLISLTDSDLQTHARNDGHDIFFTDSTGTTKIPYERELYTAGSGTLAAWVRVATLSHSTDTVIYMYYGNSKAADQQNSAGETWDVNFKSVWHSNDASPATITDSTTNANTGTKYGTEGPVETIGKIGKAQSYNGSDEYIGIIPTGALTDSFTVSTWAKVPDGETSHTIIGTRNDGDMSFDFKFDTEGIIHGDIGDGTDWITTEADATDFTYLTDTWYQITYVVTTTGYKIYINGSEAGSGSYPESAPLLFDTVHNIFIGQVGYGEEWFNGEIDEVRVSDNVRSANWIQTEYNNQNDPAMFYSLGIEEIGDTTAPTIPGIPQAEVSTDLTSQVWSWTASTDTGSGVSHYDWRIEGGPSGTTNSSTITTNLTRGNWKFHVRAEDDAGNESGENSSLLAILSPTAQAAVIDNSVPLVQIIVPDDVDAPTLDMSTITVISAGQSVASVDCDIRLKARLSLGTITVDIPSGATITGNSGIWSTNLVIPAKIILPPVALPEAGGRNVVFALEIGSKTAPLSVSRGVRIGLEGQVVNPIGSISSQGMFTEIVDTCADDSQATGDALAEQQACKITSDASLVLWVKHFTEFITYNLVAFSGNLPETGSASGKSDARAWPEETEPRPVIIVTTITGLITFVVLLLKTTKRKNIPLKTTEKTIKK